MELTPEERRRIYEEEKARLEARQVPPPPPPLPYRPRDNSTTKALLIGVMVVLACLALVIAVGQIEGNWGIGGTAQRSGEVTYRATCDGSMEISYTNPTGGMNHERVSNA